MSVSNNVVKFARFALAFLWIFTALSSTYLSPEIGFEVLATAGIEGNIAKLCLYAGSALDLLIGLWLISAWQLKKCYLLQIIAILVYSILLSIIDPSFWLHPFGPLTKNLPILALLYALYATDQTE